MRRPGRVACTGEMTKVYKIWSENLKGRPRIRWENNITTDFRETEWEVVDWIHLAQDRDQCLALVNTVMNLRVP
jgi:hypothetical protein